MTRTDNIAKYIGTISGTENWGTIKRVLMGLDLHEYVIGEEVGRGGFHHFQFAIHTAGDLREYCESNSLGWHIEDAVDWDKSKIYCRKGGKVHEYADTIEYQEFVRINKFRANTLQLAIDRSIDHQNDRAVTVWVDRQGGNGKSVWSYLNKRRGRVFTIPRSEQSAARIMDYIAQCYDGEEIIQIDLPRNNTLTKEQAEVIEQVKDGDISSAKYHGVSRNIRGVKMLITTNNGIPYRTWCSLTEDRWDVHYWKEDHEETYEPPKKHSE